MRGRREIVPGLQDKINEIFSKYPGERKSSTELRDLVYAHLDLRDFEKEHLDKSFGNYVTRAQKKGILVSQGRRRGYVISAGI